MVRNIVIAMDGSDHARRAADLAGEIAESLGAAIHILYVLPRHEVPDEIKDFPSVEHMDSSGNLELDVAHERIVGPVERALTEQGVVDVQGHALAGNPVETILDYITDHDIDMVFTGRRGLGPIEGVLLGSVSSKLNHHADCTVVTVK